MIRYTAEASADIVRLREFLEAKNPDAARRAVQEIFRTIELLERRPGVGRPTKSPDVRQMPVTFGKWGYVVRYVAKAPGDILILRIWAGLEART